MLRIEIWRSGKRWRNTRRLSFGARFFQQPWSWKGTTLSLYVMSVTLARLDQYLCLVWTDQRLLRSAPVCREVRWFQSDDWQEGDQCRVAVWTVQQRACWRAGWLSRQLLRNRPIWMSSYLHFLHGLVGVCHLYLGIRSFAICPCFRRGHERHLLGCFSGTTTSFYHFVRRTRSWL